jgi:hypothetical protein
MGETRNAYRILLRKPKGKRPRCKWVNNIKTDLREMGWHGLDCSGSGQGPVEGSWKHSNESSGSIKCWEFLE